MSASGTYAWAPTVQDVIYEALERAGIDPSAANTRQLSSARQSLNLMMASWINRVTQQYRIETRTVTLTDGDNTPTVDARCLAILQMDLVRSSRYTPMYQISRQEYYDLPDKTAEGRPDRYFLDRSADTPVLYLWRTPENSTDQIVIQQLRRAQDIQGLSDTTSAETPDVGYLWMDALCGELAKRVALKFAPDRYPLLKAEAAESFTLATHGDRDRSDTQIILRPRR